MEVSLSDLSTSRNKELSFRRNRVCTGCLGQGGRYQTCGDCGGSGMQSSVQRWGNSYVQTRSGCGTCGAQGRVLVETCRA